MRPVGARSLWVLALAVPAPAGAASVQLMVVGKTRVLREAGPVRLQARSVRVGGRRCSVGRATPLSVLAGTRLKLRLRDYGACGRSARDAGSLYVRAVAGERAKGAAGWVYKVGRRAGTTGRGRPVGAVRARALAEPGAGAVVLVRADGRRGVPADLGGLVGRLGCRGRDAGGDGARL
jgi:hypothetical protein